ncbi:type I-E CRISPR-associated protein Cas5/CasD [Legionella sp. CNM-4043-24]|uniref:type I-E CRISPR-associated protein Cas5/CasD n=1 Tax=Legionella sp. CNM-4043-24 TaxID=3421646 RepID=UPI00403B11CD
MPSHLVIRLYAPLASWGQAAVGGTRPTSVNPTRSALIGLLGAALGVHRDNAIQQDILQQSVSFAVKQLMPTCLLRDFHTIQVPSKGKQKFFTRKMELDVKDLNTILSSRDYRCDGLWVVAITLTPNAQYTLETLMYALIRPKNHLYLGRKSCPLAVPLSPKIIQTETLKEALDSEFPPLSGSIKQDDFLLGKSQMVTYLWEGEVNSLGVIADDIAMSQSWDDPISRDRWQFKQRKQYQLTNLEIE